MRVCIVLPIIIIHFICWIDVCAQTKDMLWVSDSSSKQIKPGRRILSAGDIDFYTTIMAHLITNPIYEEDKSHLYYYYCLNFRNDIKVGKLTLRSYFFNEFGIRKYKDSISAISEDMYNFRNSLLIPVGIKKLRLQVGISSKSQFWKHYDYREDNGGGLERYLFSSYLSPGYTYYTGGVSYSFWEQSSVELGLIGAQTVKIKNQKLFDERQSDRLYGLHSGQKKKTEFGFQLITNIPPYKILPKTYVEHQSLIFVSHKNVGYLNKYAIDINHAFHYFIFRYFRLSLRVKMLYEEAISHRIHMIHQFTIGYYLNNSF